MKITITNKYEESLTIKNYSKIMVVQLTDEKTPAKNIILTDKQRKLLIGYFVTLNNSKKV